MQTSKQMPAESSYGLKPAIAATGGCALFPVSLKKYQALCDLRCWATRPGAWPLSFCSTATQGRRAAIVGSRAEESVVREHEDAAPQPHQPSRL